MLYHVCPREQKREQVNQKEEDEVVAIEKLRDSDSFLFAQRESEEQDSIEKKMKGKLDQEEQTRRETKEERQSDRYKISP